jgi:hypothetical protein
MTGEGGGLPGRILKEQVREALSRGDGPARVLALGAPSRRLVNPLAGFVIRGGLVGWRAVEAMGAVVARLAGENMESARVVMRRFMWQLNDESGGIGWGAAESMAAGMALHEGLAREYGRILVSYLNPDGNWLELPALRKGAVWGTGRTAAKFPRLMAAAAPFLSLELASPDPETRALAAVALIRLAKNREPGPEVLKTLAMLSADPAQALLWNGQDLVSRTVGEWVQGAFTDGAE